MDEVEPRYRLGPLERRGTVAGWRAGQVGLVAASCTLAGLVVAGLVGLGLVRRRRAA